ncbi:hypothetical protein [endosymbiont DhMRE of Dentiscutata heterogama]|uniref:hypothetical protein n=1 Tax=endosymbiont DhMRE of Dentiscutata heterogama TaxID=1609546 RepID=UPI002AD38682|nr:hypothetical protein [endosymbiont DhMRE of Dentiscutata heterogama]
MNNNKLIFWVVISNIISLSVISLHLLNKHHEWFPSWLFCIRSVLGVLIINIILLIVWIFGYELK